VRERASTGVNRVPYTWTRSLSDLQPCLALPDNPYAYSPVSQVPCIAANPVQAAVKSILSCRPGPLHRPPSPVTWSPKIHHSFRRRGRAVATTAGVGRSEVGSRGLELNLCRSGTGTTLKVFQCAHSAVRDFCHGMWGAFTSPPTVPQTPL
jgi:hypothetical protein